MTVLTSNIGPVFTITGLGLDVASVRAVRFEPAAACTVAAANAAPGTVNGLTIASGAALNQTMISVTQNSSMAAGSYSVCVDYVASNVNGSFVKVGSSQLLIGESVCVCVYVCVFVYFSC